MHPRGSFPRSLQQAMVSGTTMPFPLPEKFWARTPQHFQGVSHRQKSLLSALDRHLVSRPVVHGSIDRLFDETLGDIPEGGCRLVDGRDAYNQRPPALLPGRPGTLSHTGGWKLPVLCSWWESSLGAHPLSPFERGAVVVLPHFRGHSANRHFTVLQSHQDQAQV